MIYKSLGGTEEKISALGLGTNGIGNRRNYNKLIVDTRIKIYKKAVDLGINYFSTAELYGEGFADEILAKAIKNKRKEIIILSKFNPENASSPKNSKRSLEGSLRRLQTDYIDIYQMHWPNALVSMEVVVSTLEKFLKQGKIRYIGVSNFDLNLIKKFSNLLQGRSFVTVENEYNILERSAEKGLLKYCEKNGQTLIAYSPLNHGRLSWNPIHLKILHYLSSKYGKKPMQIIISWLVSHNPVVSLVKTNNIKHLMENVDSLNLKLEREDIELIDNTYLSKLKYVMTEQIFLRNTDYRNEVEALENKLNLLPSPQVLAENIKAYNLFKPLRLVFKGKSSKHYYNLDDYDYMGELKKYWAWRIAFGIHKPIPSYVTQINGFS